MHGAPRLSSAKDDTAQLLWSARFWLKWATLLRDHPQHQACAGALRDGLMDCLIRLSNLPAGQAHMAQLTAAFRQWGGCRLHVTPRPRNLLKRAVGDAVANIGGFPALHLLLGIVDNLHSGDRPYLDTLQAPATDADREDARHIKTYEAKIGRQAETGRNRATMASRARR